MKHILIIATVMAGVSTAMGQYQFRWRTEPREAIAEARRTMRPLMVYVLASSHDRDDDIERAQKAALADPRVLQQVGAFVPLRLSRSVYRENLADFGLPESANMMMSFVAPDGTVLGTLGAGGVAQADSLLKKMSLVIKAYRTKLYEERVKPQLTNAEAKPAELKQALELAAVFRMPEAEKDAMALLENKPLDQSVHDAICDLLAALSTKESVETLLMLWWNGDKYATRALEKCTPAGAELMLPYMAPEGHEFQYALYQAVTRICDIKRTKPERFFEHANDKLKNEEIDRVAKLVHDAAQRWREATE